MLESIDSHMNEEHKIGYEETIGKTLIAKKDYEIGDIVISSRRKCVEKERTSHSIQWDYETHILMEEPAIFINHSCDPNLFTRRNDKNCYDFVARKKIEAGTSLCFDYESTEWSLISVFKCFCGTERCRETINGYKFKSELLKKLYNNELADYLKN